MNRGELNQFIEIWEKVPKDNFIDELGEKQDDKKLVAAVFAKKEFRGGGLLTGRAADTVLTQTTHKFTYPYKEYPNLINDKNWIMHNGKKYEILYTLDENNKNEFLQVFCKEEVFR